MPELAAPQPVLTSLSGNEMYCLARKQLRAGSIVLGNSVVSLGLAGAVFSAVGILLGGEVRSVTAAILAGRRASLERLEAEVQAQGAAGAIGVRSELIFLGANIELVALGSCVQHLAAAPASCAPSFHTLSHSTQGLPASSSSTFSAGSDGQALYCQLDCGYQPRRFVVGTCAYSVGLAGAVVGAVRGLRRGEVREYSAAFRHTRLLALERITDEARACGANAVLGIRTSIVPFHGLQEMLMQGTASYHPDLPPEANLHPVTSDLTNQELWSVTRAGFRPVRLVLGVSVYALGLVDRFSSMVRGLVRGEIPELTHLVHEARDQALTQLREQAEQCGADDVLGIKLYLYTLGKGMIEVLAIGTAVRRDAGARTHAEQLPVQAILQEQSTFLNLVDGAEKLGSGSAAKRGNSGAHLLEMLLKEISS